jgi:hypothetical protein
VCYSFHVEEETILGAFILENDEIIKKDDVLIEPNIQIVKEYLKKCFNPTKTFLIDLYAENKKEKGLCDVFTNGLDKDAVDLIEKNALEEHIFIIAEQINNYFPGKAISLKYFKEPENSDGYSALIIKIHTEKYDEKYVSAKKQFQEEWFFDYLEEKEIDQDIVISLV